MANFSLRVDSKSFSYLGVKPKFDENSYGALLDIVVPGLQTTEEPDIWLTPNIFFWNVGILKELIETAKGKNYTCYGQYHPAVRGMVH